MVLLNAKESILSNGACTTGIHPHPKHYSLELQINSSNSVVHLASNKSTQLFDVGAASISTQRTRKVLAGRNDCHVVMPQASDPAEQTVASLKS